MSRAIMMRAGQNTFLVETDVSVSIPAQLHLVSTEPLAGVPEGMQPVRDVAGLERDFAEVQNLIVACGNGLFEAIANVPTPEKVTVEFAIKLAGESGFPMLTKVSGEANFKVLIEWTKD